MTSPKTIPGAHPGEVSANTLVHHLAAGKPPANATMVHDAGTLPAVLATVKDAIAKNPTTPVWDILLGAIRDEIVLRPSFTFATTPAKPPADREKVFRNMSSGASEYAFDLPKLSLTKFFADMFAGIVKGHPATAIYEFDLFHGHVTPNEAMRDVVIVFHAKEYPADVVNSFQRKRYADAGLITPGVKPFDSSSKLMDERNFIWTLSTNKVFLLNGAIRHTDLTSDFACLMGRQGNARSLDRTEVQMGTVQERQFGPELFTVNYFPTLLAGDHATQVFFNPVGAWGVLMYLGKAYPTISAKNIADLYASTDESLAKTKAGLESLLKTKGQST